MAWGAAWCPFPGHLAMTGSKDRLAVTRAPLSAKAHARSGGARDPALVQRGEPAARRAQLVGRAVLDQAAVLHRHLPGL
jgi:hypothetical protein